MDKLALRKISAIYLIYATEQVGFTLAWSKTIKTDFLASRPVYQLIQFYFPHMDNLSRDMRFPTK